MDFTPFWSVKGAEELGGHDPNTLKVDRIAYRLYKIGMHLPSEQTWRVVFRSAKLLGLGVNEGNQHDLLDKCKEALAKRRRKGPKLEGERWQERFSTIDDIAVAEPYAADDPCAAMAEPTDSSQAFDIRLRKPHGPLVFRGWFLCLILVT